MSVPKPPPDALVLYLMGPGYGESIVLAVPGGKWVVIDACLDRDRCLPAELLRVLGAEQLDLLIITHPDFDHINGVEKLLEAYEPRDVWTYPLGSSIRDLLAGWRARRGLEPTPLDRALNTVESLAPVIRTYRTRPWEAAPDGMVLACLAPTRYDLQRARGTFNQLITDPRRPRRPRRPGDRFPAG